ncbi:MAG: hypothetical protein D6750_08960 [Bacteroidetes bacterium]|nr:MAG: hypothetical protein D6750_08960 [Bacteroidota bacterium]
MCLRPLVRGSLPYSYPPASYQLLVWAPQSRLPIEDLRSCQIEIGNACQPSPSRTFPNPASQTLWIEVPLHDAGSGTLLTPNGQPLLSSPLKPGLPLLLSPALPHGLYLLRCQGQKYTGSPSILCIPKKGAKRVGL